MARDANPAAPTSSRSDGRSATQLRPMQAGLGPLLRADGSAKFSSGGTSVLAAVYGPKDVKIKDEKLDKAFVEVQLHPLVGATGTRERLYERILHGAVESLVLTALHPRTSVLVVLQIVSDDGCILPTAVNAAVLALLDAGVPMRSTASAAAAAFLADGSLLLDPTLEELASAASAHVFAFEPLAGADDGPLAELSTGRFSRAQLHEALEVCRSGSAKTGEFMRTSVTMRLTKREA
ncbi:exosome non-catalytic core subunit rrp46, partial [Cladochytrium tenue]